MQKIYNNYIRSKSVIVNNNGIIWKKKVKESGCKGNKNFEITIITNSFC